MNKKIEPLILFLFSFILYILSVFLRDNFPLGAWVEVSSLVFFIIGIISAIKNTIQRRKESKSKQSEKEDKKNFIKIFNDKKNKIFILVIASALILLLMILVFSNYINKKSDSDYFSNNLDCETQKEYIQYSYDNYNAELDSVINKVSEVFYSPRINKCVYVSVSSFDFDAPLNQTWLTTKDYSDGARWRLRTISGQVIEDYLINLDADNDIFVFGKQADNIGSYEDFKEAIKKWR